jgi:hypothetical protein
MKCLEDKGNEAKSIPYLMAIKLKLMKGYTTFTSCVSSAKPGEAIKQLLLELKCVGF